MRVVMMETVVGAVFESGVDERWERVGGGRSCS
jgi:hypothetical protein